MIPKGRKLVTSEGVYRTAIYDVSDYTHASRTISVRNPRNQRNSLSTRSSPMTHLLRLAVLRGFPFFRPHSIMNPLAHDGFAGSNLGTRRVNTRRFKPYMICVNIRIRTEFEKLYRYFFNINI